MSECTHNCNQGKNCICFIQPTNDLHSADLVQRLRTSGSVRSWEEADKQRAEAADRIDELERRLEIDPRHHIDGIEARDQTIKIQDEEIAKITETRDAWERGFAERGKRIEELERELAAERCLSLRTQVEQLERENAELLAALRTMISTFDGVLDGDAADAYGATDALKTACAAIAKHGGKNE